jgi:GT2 family glycosyltransferase
MHTLALVVVTHNSASWLGRFVETWKLAAEKASGVDVPVVVADSGSQDDTLAVAWKLLPTASFLRLGHVGFGAAANAGIREATADWILLCNPDLSFPPEFAARLAAALAQATGPVACIAPRLLNPDGTTQPSVGPFPSFGRIVRDQFRPRPCRKYACPKPSAAGPVDWATGACLLLRREAVLAAGGFDEKYFLYVEEVDLQRRLRAAGRTVWFATDLCVIHHQPNARRLPQTEIQRYAARGLLRYFAKFGGGLAGYRLMAFISGRLPAREVFASRRQILECPTGP